jgi:hypothetical protein
VLNTSADGMMDGDDNTPAPPAGGGFGTGAFSGFGNSGGAQAPAASTGFAFGQSNATPAFGSGSISGGFAFGSGGSSTGAAAAGGGGFAFGGASSFGAFNAGVRSRSQERTPMFSCADLEYVDDS